MAVEQTRYRRLLPKGRTKAGGMTTLWVADDHLLQETRFGTTHLYHRFFFQDIHGLIIRRTNTGAMYNGLLMAAVGIVTLIMLSAPHVLYLWIGLDTVFAGGLLWNISRGPTCTCYLQTAVHMRHLPSLARTKAAVAALDALQPIVSDAQGGGTPEEVRDAAIADASALAPTESPEPPLPPTNA